MSHYPPVRLTRRGLGVAVAAVAVALPLVVGTVPAGAAGSAAVVAQADGRAAVSGLSAEVLAAMQRDLGLSPDRARTLAAQQTKAIAADRTLRARLGGTFVGSWFDTASGTLVVNVTTPGAAGQVTAAGARARVVAHAKTRLDGIKAKLDALAGSPAGAGAKARSVVARHKSTALAGLTSWYVDPKADRVVVTAIKRQLSRESKALLTGYGDAVRVRYVTEAPRAAANFMDGGDEINGGSCSAGFNLRNPNTGQGYLLTAGHCVTAGTTVTGQGGVPFGPVLESWFPIYDDALVRNDNPGHWIQGPWVDLDPSNGPVTTVVGFSDGPVGTFICKSGITTRLTCGKITAMRVTVVFVGGLTVFDETQHDACVEPGDSGGANYAVGSPSTAEGVTSGAQLYGPGLRCGAAVGQPTVSWYYPIALSLAYYGPRYGVTTWL